MSAPAFPCAPRVRRAWLAGIATLASVGGIVGCATPNPTPAPVAAVPVVAVPAAWVAPPAPTGDSVDLATWWQAFGDPTLDGLVARALEGAPDVEASAAKLRAVTAMADEAAARLGPRLSLVAAPQQTASGRSTYFQGGLAAEWDIPLELRRTSARGLMEAELQGALADQQAVRATVVAEVARAYFEMRAAEREQHLLGQLAALADERERLARVLLGTRQTAADAVQVAAVARMQARAAVAEPGTQAALARARLGVLLGDLQVALPEPAADSAAPPRSLLALTALPADLVRQRPAIRRAEQSVLRAAHVAGLARADAQPRISLAGLVGLTAAITGPASGGVRAILSLGPSFSMSLFDGGERAAAQRARDAEFDVATAEYRKAVLQGVAEAQSALVQLDHERRRMAAVAEIEAAVRRRADATEAQVRLGLADGFQRADARGAALQAGRETLRAGLAEQVAYIALFNAFGGAGLPASAPVAAVAP